MEHPKHFGLQHVAPTGWHSFKTLQELINTLPELLPKVHYLSRKKQLLPHKTRGQAMWRLFLKGNIKGQKILSRQTRKFCIRTELIMWKGKSWSWQSDRALKQANYHHDKAAWLLQGEVLSLTGSVRIPEACQSSSEEHWYVQLVLTFINPLTEPLQKAAREAQLPWGEKSHQTGSHSG